ncbi:hypothetical protein C5E44_25180 [Nocardia nova]|uniref:UbiX family flavin prenyltransferase n=1 Tax=Nocardia nova TaxID=37330 RepID=UPI000CE9E29E|nr:hypothetical protein C5E44_25180 [Nocardia nova]
MPTTPRRSPRLVVGISGATGIAYGVRALEFARKAGVQTHLVVTPAGQQTRRYETELSAKDLAAMADVVYRPSDIGAAIASGSFRTAGMLVAPCSIRTLSAIAYGNGDNLLTRAADVTLKERRRLVLLVRETPLTLGHLRIALAIGVEPALPWVGGMPLPEGADESHYLGALFGEGIEVVPAETVDLMVPATAEIVIEGHISLNETVLEGPFNEFPGYNATEATPKQVFHVSAITYRDGAIQPTVAAGPPVEEDHTIIGTTSAAEILYLLRERGLPVSSAWYNFEAAVHWLTLAIRQDWHESTGLASHELIDRIAAVIFTGKTSVNAPKILVVEDDVDITALDEVVWAFATRSHPDVGRGEFHYPPAVSDQLAVYLSEEEAHSFKAGKVVYNCLLADLYPGGRRPVKGSFYNGWPAEIQQRVLSNWHKYGYR